ncbi:MAG: MFS transporter [Candidatus Dormibacteraeota bacterium]|nr:MFS transporter [Candidatus Dormibacteraeota bacterium]
MRRFPEVVLGSSLARVGEQMVAIAMVLFVLTTYHSAPLAGLVGFLSIFPGLVFAPLAGALLDRHGRKWLIIIDYLIAMLTIGLIGLLALAHLLPIWLLLLITGVSSLSAPLGNVGMRTLFPLIVPRHLWERANAVDSNGYVVASLFGPALAGAIVGFLGGPAALLATASLFGVAALVLTRIDDPPTTMASSGKLIRDAWDGVVYVFRNASLRGIALSLGIGNIGGGMMYIALPVLVLQRFHQGPVTVGALFAVLGGAGLVTATLAGRMRTEGIERQMLGVPQAVFGLGLASLAFAPNLAVVVAALAFMGMAIGPSDIALFTLRQRRTDPNWMGRAFAVSMSLNFAGFPVGAVIGGRLVSWSLPGTLLVGAALLLVAAIIPFVAIPKTGDLPAEGLPLTPG